MDSKVIGLLFVLTLTGCQSQGVYLRTGFEMEGSVFTPYIAKPVMESYTTMFCGDASQESRSAHMTSRNGFKRVGVSAQCLKPLP